MSTEGHWFAAQGGFPTRSGPLLDAEVAWCAALVHRGWRPRDQRPAFERLQAPAKTLSAISPSCDRHGHSFMGTHTGHPRQTCKEPPVQGIRGRQQTNNSARLKQDEFKTDVSCTSKGSQRVPFLVGVLHEGSAMRHTIIYQGHAFVLFCRSRSGGRPRGGGGGLGNAEGGERARLAPTTLIR